MPVVEIARIQIRRGQSTELPNLEEGELGQALDTGEAFVGAPNFALTRDRSNYPFQNVQLLTEFSPNIEDLLMYTYLYRNANNVQRSFPILNGGTIARNLQEKIDEKVSVKDYGAIGDFDTDDTIAINTAILDVVSLNSNPDNLYVRALYFPAGMYKTNDSLNLPPGIILCGDGPGRSIIVCNNSQIFCVAQTISAGISPSQYADPTLRAQQLPLVQNYNITSDFPYNIALFGLTLQHAFNRDILHLVRSNKVFAFNCQFSGGWNYTRTYTSGDYINDLNPNSSPDLNDSMALLIDSLGGALTSEDFLFSNCWFDSTTFVSRLTDRVRNLVFENCKYAKHWQGVVAGGGSQIQLANRGYLSIGASPPSRIVVTASEFDTIAKEAVIANTGVGFCNLSTNTYVNVGVGINSDGTPGTTNVAACVAFAEGSMYNTSQGDVFETRLGTATSYATSRVNYFTADNNLVLNAQDPVFFPHGIIFQNGFQAGITGVLSMLPSQNTASSFNSNGVSDPFTFVITSVPSDGNTLSQNNITLQYSLTINSGTQTRSGALKITTNGSEISFDDNFTELQDTSGFSFVPLITSQNTLELKYINTTANAAMFKYSYSTIPL